jgi:GNAT superfamily N-acetyltransferase
MITFHVERLSDELDNLKPWFPKHWAELALDQEKVPLDPQYHVYLDREARGEVLFVAARDRGKIVGYFVGFVAPGLHYKTCLTLTMDIFWVEPEHRGSNAGFQLFEFVEKEAKQRGVQRMFVGSKLHKDASFLFEKLGYIEVERYYSAWLGD